MNARAVTNPSGHDPPMQADTNLRAGVLSLASFEDAASCSRKAAGERVGLSRELGREDDLLCYSFIGGLCSREELRAVFGVAGVAPHDDDGLVIREGSGLDTNRLTGLLRPSIQPSGEGKRGRIGPV